MGIMVAANLKQQYSGQAFGMILKDFNNRGGFDQFVATVACCGAVAAFMSTADSSVISATTCMATEFLQNWLFKIKPNLDTPRFMKIFACSCSTTIILIATYFALYDKALNDPKTLAYSMMGQYQSMFFSFPAIAIMSAMFLPKASDWAMLGGLACGWLTFLVL